MGSFGKDNEYGYGIANAYFTIAYDNMDIDGKEFGGLQKFSASNLITSENTDINNGSDVSYISGNKIVLKSGFHAKNGSNFNARIDMNGPCSSGPFRLANPNGGGGDEHNNKDTAANNNLANKIKIYPNPSTQTFNILSTKEFESMPQVMNITGKSIAVQFKKLSDKKLQIDMSGYPKGKVGS